MNDDTKARIEKMLREVGPILSKGDQRVEVPPHVLARLQAAKEKKFPGMQMVTAKEMDSLLLKVLAERPMDGVELILGLEKAHIQLKDASEGVIYGILSKLESAGYLKADWREQGGRMMKTYHITDTGRGQVKPSTADATQMDAWSARILALEASGA
jgi:DNA-binding PadR family transcriptional regulator